MKRLLVSDDVPFAVQWQQGRRTQRNWLSVHKTIGEAQRAAYAAEKKHPRKTFTVWKWWPNLKAAFPISSH